MKWIDVNEALPTPGEVVLAKDSTGNWGGAVYDGRETRSWFQPVCHGCGNMPGFYDPNEKWTNRPERMSYISVSHWMKLN